MADWQPIETAPRDGTEVIVWAEFPNGARACFDRYSTDPADYINRQMPEGGQWVWTYLDGGPTRWMPIPQPPE